MINFLSWMCSGAPFPLREPPKLPPQTNKFDYILDITQFLQIWTDSGLIEMNDVNNVIYNNFKWHNQLQKINHFLSRSL